MKNWELEIWDYEIFIVICVCRGIADGGEVDLFPRAEFCKA